MSTLRFAILILICLTILPDTQAQKNKKKKSAPVAQNTADSRLSFFKFRSPGPTRGGRVTAVAGVVSKPGTFYMGATGGGVWKTVDYGVSWNNISDGFFATPSIGDIDVYQENPDIIYVGTGSDGIRSNVISGKGVYKSEDGGKKWKHVGLDKVGQIGAVIIDPKNPKVVFVAAIGQAFQPNKERGVYRTVDGGEHWEQVLFHSDTVGAVDLVFAPDNSQVIYAATWRAERKPWTIISGCDGCGGIYKSTNGGTTWQKLTEGLPKGLIGKIDLGVSPAKPGYLYALIEAPEGTGGLYRSEDYGKTFKYIPSKDTKTLIRRPFYYCNLAVNPQNAESIYSMTEPLLHSTDGGKSWKRMSTPHGDNHKIWMNPNDTLTFIEANDGGVNITTTGGKTWSTQYNQPTAELYQIDVDDQYPYWLYAGQQDEQTIAVPSLPPYSLPGDDTGYWRIVGGCETGPAVPKPGDPNTVYANCKGRFGVYNKVTGQEKQYYVGAADMYGHNPKDLKFRFQRVSPIIVSPHNANVIYHTSQYVHKTTDEGVTWQTISPDLTAYTPETQVISGSPITRDITGEEFYSTIYAIRESPRKEGIIWVGANDGPVHVTQDGGGHWENVTPQGLAPGGRVDCVEPSPHQDGKAYVTILRYQLGDWKPYLFKTLDFGKSWKLITNGIPADYPVRVVREDPDMEGLLYAGTEYGLFISFDDGEHWEKFQQNLPIVPVSDIKVYRGDLILSTMGRSFWILDNLSTLHQLKSVANNKPYLFKPSDTYRYRYYGSRGQDIPNYPVPGVAIDYFIADKPANDIRLEIMDSKGNIIKSVDSYVKQDTAKSKDSNSRARKADLDKSVGMHRFNWNMRHKGPWDKNPDSNQSGPYVSPGKYSVKLTVGKQEFHQSFMVLKDPRVEVPDEDLSSQEKLALEVQTLLDTAKRLAFRIDELKKHLAKEGKDTTAIQSLKNELVTIEGTYETPMLIDQVDYLGSMLNHADQKPGKDAYDRYEELNAEFKKVLTRFSSLGMAGSVGKN